MWSVRFGYSFDFLKVFFPHEILQQSISNRSTEVRLALRAIFRSVTRESIVITNPLSFPSRTVADSFDVHCDRSSSPGVHVPDGCTEEGRPFGGYETLVTLQDHARDYPIEIYEIFLKECRQLCRDSLRLFQFDQASFASFETPELPSHDRHNDWRFRYIFKQHVSPDAAVDEFQLHSVSLNILMRHTLQVRTNAIAILRSSQNSKGRDGER
jgi:hypothetical protein